MSLQWYVSRYCLDIEVLRTTCCFTSPHPSPAHLHITWLLRQQAQVCHLYLHGAWHLHTGKAIRPEPGSLIQRRRDRFSLIASAIRFHGGMKWWRWRSPPHFSMQTNPLRVSQRNKAFACSLRLLFFRFFFILLLGDVNTHTNINALKNVSVYYKQNESRHYIDPLFERVSNVYLRFKVKLLQVKTPPFLSILTTSEFIFLPAWWFPTNWLKDAVHSNPSRILPIPTNCSQFFLDPFH